jgi:hypothetical protein
MAHHVFISYSSQDAEQGEQVCAALERHGISCWMAPRDIVPGVGWAKSIIQVINGARAMVFVVSAHPTTCRKWSAKWSGPSTSAFPSSRFASRT